MSVIRVSKNRAEFLFWEQMSHISELEANADWVMVDNRLHNLLTFARAVDLPRALQARCHLKIAEIGANYGGFGTKLSGIRAASAGLSLISPDAEPELICGLLFARAVALHAAGADPYALDTLSDSMALVRTKSLPKSYSFAASCQLAQSLHALGEYNRASAILERTLLQALDGSSFRDILLITLRLAETYTSSGMRAASEEYLSCYNELSQTASIMLVPSETLRLKVISSRVMATHYLQFGEKHLAAPIIDRALLEAESYGYLFQQARLLRLKNLIEES